ncbi:MULTISPECIES: 2,3-diphosphoglycerate-dependent phosphoglycerate mutase, partial [unclassified Pseudomonas]
MTTPPKASPGAHSSLPPPPSPWASLGNLHKLRRNEGLTLYRLVLVRHGESLWNQRNLFTGWADVDLSAQGITQATTAGRRLRAAGFTFDVAHTSVLKRAVRTLWGIQDAMDLMWLPVSTTWRLNERHYGTLTSMNKDAAVARFGEEQVHIWRRSFDIAPPPSPEGLPESRADRRYVNLTPNDYPRSESLEDTQVRLLPYWHETLGPQILAGKHVLVVAHGNSLRALIKYLDDISDQDISNLNVP